MNEKLEIYSKALKDPVFSKILDKADPNDYLDLLKRKAEEEEALNFEKFLFQNTNHNDPSEVRRLYENFPSVLESRLAEVDMIAEKYRKAGLIAYRGVVHPDDYAFAYEVDQGNIIIDGTILNILLGISSGPEIIRQEANFQRGLITSSLFGRLDNSTTIGINPKKPFVIDEDGRVRINSTQKEREPFSRKIGKSFSALFS